MGEREGPGQLEALAFFVTVVGTLLAAFSLGALVSVWVGVLSIAAGLLVLIVLSLFRRKVYRLVHFLFLLGSERVEHPPAGKRATAWDTVIRKGADRDDSNAPRVVIQDTSGKDHLSEVLPHDGDLEQAWRQTIVGLQVPVEEVRGERDGAVVHVWKPSLVGRFSAAWAVAWRG